MLAARNGNSVSPFTEPFQFGLQRRDVVFLATNNTISYCINFGSDHSLCVFFRDRSVAMKMHDKIPIHGQFTCDSHCCVYRNITSIKTKRAAFSGSAFDELQAIAKLVGERDDIASVEFTRIHKEIEFADWPICLFKCSNQLFKISNLYFCRWQLSLCAQPSHRWQSNTQSSGCSNPTTQSADPFAGASDWCFGSAVCCFKPAKPHIAIKLIADKQHQQNSQASTKAEGEDVGGFEHGLTLFLGHFDQTSKDIGIDVSVCRARNLRLEHGLEDNFLLFVCQFVPVSCAHFGVNLRQCFAIASITEHVEALHKHPAEMLHEPCKQNSRNGDNCGAPYRSLGEYLDVFFKFFRVIDDWHELLTKNIDSPEQKPEGAKEQNKASKCENYAVRGGGTPFFCSRAQCQFTLRLFLRCLKACLQSFEFLLLDPQAPRIIERGNCKFRNDFGAFTRSPSDTMDCGFARAFTFHPKLQGVREVSLFLTQLAICFINPRRKIDVCQIGNCIQAPKSISRLIKNVKSNGTFWQKNSIFAYGFSQHLYWFKFALKSTQMRLFEKSACFINMRMPIGCAADQFQFADTAFGCGEPLVKFLTVIEFDKKRLLCVCYGNSSGAIPLFDWEAERIFWLQLFFKILRKAKACCEKHSKCKNREYCQSGEFQNSNYRLTIKKYINNDRNNYRCNTEHSERCEHSSGKGRTVKSEFTCINDFHKSGPVFVCSECILFLLRLCINPAYLTIQPNTRMIPGEASEPLLLADTAPVSQRYFCARNPVNGRIACALAYGREGGEYNTLRGNKPACLAQVLNLPLTSGSSEALCEWCFNAMLGAFVMTCHSSRQRRSCALSHCLDQIDLALEAERTLIDAMLFVANETLCDGREGPMLHGLLFLLSEHQDRTEQAASDAHKVLRQFKQCEVA